MFRGLLVLAKTPVPFWVAVAMFVCGMWMVADIESWLESR
jgi:hypothetical protein